MRCRGLLVAAGLLLLVPATADADRADVTVDLGTRQTNAPATLKLDVVFRHPDDPNAKPPPIRGGEYRLPAGTRIDTAGTPKCEATDEELRARGPAACPADTRVGTGSLVAITGFGPPADPAGGDVTIFNGENQIIEVVTAPDTDRVLGLDRVTVEGSTLTPHPPRTPGGPPDGETAIKEVHLIFDRPRYVTSPPDCPASGWIYGATLQFGDGGTHAESGVLPCDGSAAGGGVAGRPPMAFVARRPARPRVGRLTRFRFRLGSSNPACVRGAKVRFAGRRARTDANGIAFVTATLRRPGRHLVNASKRGCRTARASVIAR